MIAPHLADNAGAAGVLPAQAAMRPAAPPSASVDQAALWHNAISIPWPHQLPAGRILGPGSAGASRYEMALPAK
jgi:hypothetical protein